MRVHVARLLAVGTTVVLAISSAPLTATAASATARPVSGWRDIGTLGGANAYPSGVNRSGEVVGSSQLDDGSFRAFRWRDGTMTALATAGSDSAAIAVNDRGDVAGAVGFPDGSFRATVWHRGSAMDLGTLGGSWSAAQGINTGGVVIGASGVSGRDRPGRAFRWRAGEGMTELPGRDPVTVATGINDRGDIVGYVSAVDGSQRRGALWRGSRLIIIDPPFGRPGTAHADVINDRGQILGGVDTDDLGEHGFLWDRGVYTDLGRGLPEDLNDRGKAALSDPSTPPAHAVRWYRGVRTDLPGLGGSSSAASDINALGQVAGRSSTRDGTEHPVVWSATGAIVPLAPLPGGAAQFINDRGRVVGHVPVGDGSIHTVVADLHPAAR